MNDERSTDLLSALPRTRPHRRSDKRGDAPAKPEGQNSPDAASAPAARTPTAARKAAAARKPTAIRKATTRKAATGKPGARNPADPKPLRQPAQPRGIPHARRAPK